MKILHTKGAETGRFSMTSENESNTPQDVSGILFFVNRPDNNGRIYSEESLRQMAKDSNHLIYDEENKCLRVTIPSCW